MADASQANAEKIDKEKGNTEHAVNDQAAKDAIIKAWTKVDHSEVIAEVVKTNVINEVKNQLPKLLPKAVSDFVILGIESKVHEKIKLEHATKQPLPKHLEKPFDQAAKAKYDQKEILFKMMRDSKSHEKHPTYKALYDALMLSLVLDEDDIERAKATEPPTQKKRRHDDKDQDPRAGSDQGMKKSKKSKDVKPSKNTKKSGSSKGTCKSYVELEYNIEECYRALSDQLDWDNPEGDRFHGWVDDFPRVHLNDIEDMHLLIIQNKHFNLEGDVIVDLAVALRMPQKRDVDISFKEPYTTHSKPHGVIYKDKLERKTLMRTDELYKFSDGTLKSVCNTLHHMLLNFRLGY
ncbi:hypothetical protein Tco_0006401 [Tanacetum coccineum]